MGNPKKFPKSSISSQRWNHLYQAAQFCLYKNIQNRKQSLIENSLSDYYTYISVNVAKKSLFKIEPQVKRYVCKGCEGLLFPGVTAQVRVLKKPASVIEWRCLKCQTCKKYPSIRHYESSFENATLKCENIESDVRKSVSNVGKNMAEHMIQ
jgi:ribonuclease P protein subunit RPR2